MSPFKAIRNRLLKQAQPACGQPAKLQLGAGKGGHAHGVSLPCAIEVVGLAGSGRSSFLLAVARQAMERGDSVLFMSGYGPKEWAGFWHAAHETGRASECYADVPFGTTSTVDVLELVDKGALLYFGEEGAPPSGGRATGCVNEVLAAAHRHESSRRAHDLMVIFDGFDPWLDLRLMQPLADMSKVSLISSSTRYWSEGPDMPLSTCQVVFRHDKDWVMCDPQGRWLPPPMTVRAGEAVVVSRQPPPNPPFAVKIALPKPMRSPSATEKEFRPVNAVEMAAQSS